MVLLNVEEAPAYSVSQYVPVSLCPLEFELLLYCEALHELNYFFFDKTLFYHEEAGHSITLPPRFEQTSPKSKGGLKSSQPMKILSIRLV